MDPPDASTTPPPRRRFGFVAAAVSLVRWYHSSSWGRALENRIEQIRAAAAEARFRAALKSCGDDVTLDPLMTIKGPQNVSIGDRSAVAAYVHIWGHGGVDIGDDVMIASHTAISSVTHDYNAEQMNRTIVTTPVRIEDGVWIGAHAVIMPGVTVGRGAVVGAGAVVTRDVPPRAVVVGVPAKVRAYRPGGAS